MAAFDILMDKTGTGKGPLRNIPNVPTRYNDTRSIQATVEGPAPVSATVKIYTCNDGRFPVEIAQFSLSSTGTVASEIFADDTSCEVYMAEVIAVSANAKVSVVGSI